MTDQELISKAMSLLGKRGGAALTGKAKTIQHRNNISEGMRKLWKKRKSKKTGN